MTFPPPARRPGLQAIAATIVLGGLGLVPVAAAIAGEPFYLVLVSRILIFALAAVGLNLVLGYGAMVSLGHALYLGIGAYAVGILSAHGVNSGYLQLGVALVVGLAVAVPIGLVCLRASGLAFIMITLAFAQMFYFLAVGLKQYGGDDGLPLAARSDFGWFTLENATVLYYAIYVVLAAVLFLFHRLIHARFGMVLRGTRSNDRRMKALGFPTLRYRLAAYALSALVCVVAGMFLANLTRYTSPSYMAWSMSGDLIVMVVLGGIGTLVGPVIGAVVWVAIEEVMSGFRLDLPWGADAFIRDHWLLLLGGFIVVVTLTLKQGLYGSLPKPREDRS